MSILSPAVIGRHYLAAVTVATIAIEIGRLHILKKMSALATLTLSTNKVVPLSDQLAVNAVDMLNATLAETASSIGMVLILATFALAIAKGKTATLALCAIAVTFAVFGGSLITSSLVAAVPKFKLVLGNATPMEAAAMSQFSLPASIAIAISLSMLAFTLVVAYITAKDVMAKGEPKSPAGESPLEVAA